MKTSDYLKEGQKCERSKDYEGAINNYTKALTLAHSTYLLHYMRGCVYQKMGEMEKAAEDFRDFLLEDTRVPKLGTTPWGFTHGAIESAKIGLQRSTAQLALTQITFQRILKLAKPLDNPFDVDYSNKKLYDWKRASIADTPEEAVMLDETPQEVAYRNGVKFFLQGNHEKAARVLSEAIKMNPEDARPYLFRGMVYYFQSRKKGLVGPSNSARKLSRSKFESDLERALVLSNGKKSVEQACWRTKCLFAEYERERERLEGAVIKRGFSTLWFFVSGFGLLIGSLWMIAGIRAVVESAFYARLHIAPGVIFILLGAMVLFGGFSIYRRKRKRGVILILAGFLTLFILITLEIL